MEKTGQHKQRRSGRVQKRQQPKINCRRKRKKHFRWREHKFRQSFAIGIQERRRRVQKLERRLGSSEAAARLPRANLSGDPGRPSEIHGKLGKNDAANPPGIPRRSRQNRRPGNSPGVARKIRHRKIHCYEARPQRFASKSKISRNPHPRQNFIQHRETRLEDR